MKFAEVVVQGLEQRFVNGSLWCFDSHSDSPILKMTSNKFHGHINMEGRK